MAVTVVDGWQGLGLGTVLLELLTERAREEGIETFSALMLSTNAEVLDLLRRLGRNARERTNGSCLEVGTEPPAGVHPGLRELLAGQRIPPRG